MEITYSIFEEHLQYILDFWKPAIDFEKGGVHWVVQVLPQFSIKKRTEKSLLMHVRHLYNYSCGKQYGIEGAAEIAHHLYQSLDTVFPQHNGIYESGHQGIQPLIRPEIYPKLSSYDQCYTVIGLAKYAGVFSDEQAYHKAKNLLYRTREVFEDLPYKERGMFAEISLPTGEKSGKTGNSFLHTLEALVNLLQTVDIIFKNPERRNMERQQLTAYVEEVYDIFISHLFHPQDSTVPDKRELDLTLPPHYASMHTTMAHPLEWVGFFFEAELVTGVHFDFNGVKARSVVDLVIERALANNGCFKNAYLPRQDACLLKSEFWSQSEAVLGMLFAWRQFGNRRYLNDAVKAALFYFTNFVDTVYGGINEEVDANGTVISMRKGGIYKCDHHSLRMCEKVLQYRLLD